MHDVWRRGVCLCVCVQVTGGKCTEEIFYTYVDIKVKSVRKFMSEGSDWV